MTSTTHPEFVAFYQDILADPLDDTLRLLAADWLEDHGEAGRAEFIRVQIELAAWEERNAWAFRLRRCQGHGWLDPTCSECRPFTRVHRDWLKRREEELWSEGRAWWAPQWALLGDATNELYWWDRGFVGHLRVPTLKQFESWRSDVALEVPVVSVDIGDRKPFQNLDLCDGIGWIVCKIANRQPGSFSWETTLPASIGVHLIGHARNQWLQNDCFLIYDSPQLAVQDLSRACVHYLRQLAALPHLEELP